MSSNQQHDAKRSKGEQTETKTTSKASDTGSAARKSPPKEQPAKPSGQR